jgi:hypothetical protein
MKKQFLRWGCLLTSLFIVVLLVVGGGWWFLRPQDGTAEQPSSLVQVFLLSPAGGDEFSVGDYLQVRAQSFAPEAIASVELFVD